MTEDPITLRDKIWAYILLVLLLSSSFALGWVLRPLWELHR